MDRFSLIHFHLRGVCWHCFLTYIVVAASYRIVGVAVLWTGSADPLGASFDGFAAQIVQYVLPYLLPLLCLVAAISAARGRERARVVWASSTLGTFFTIRMGVIIMEIFLPGFATQHGHRFLQIVINVAVLVAPIGLTYSVLSRRLLDIGFAFNRAVVFSGVSIVTLGTFVFVEWLLNEWLRGASPSTNIIVSALFALALGLSVRFIHLRVEHVADRVLFRKRHEDEQALRIFTHEAAYISDKDTLLKRAADVLDLHVGALSVDMALNDGNGRYGTVGEDDPAIVRLRAKHEILDLHAVATELRGEFAYHMVARGRLLGALVLGPKRSGESYAPDESSAIAQLALGVAAALYVLSNTREESQTAILNAVQELSEVTRTLFEVTRALPEAITHRVFGIRIRRTLQRFKDR